MIDRINGRVAVLVTACAVLVVLLVGWFAFVSPQRSKAARLGDQVNSLQAQIASTQAYLTSPEAKNAPRELRRLKLSIPDDIQMSQILRQLAGAASRAGVTINAITPQGLVPSAGGQAVPITLAVQGHYFRLSKFMHILRSKADVRNNAIHGPGRLYSIDGIQFAGGGSGPQVANLISASIALDAFIATPAPPPPPTTTTTTG